MHCHLGHLLSSGEGADIALEVDGETFSAHRSILAARSPVFTAQLFGPMRENTAVCVWIEGVEVGVFKALLHFVYTDSLPEVGDGEAMAMAQHLLVAADRYSLERLKLICEDKLCNHIDTSTVGTILALAEQHSCHGL
ncbi:BTB/POZ and MATH domain-containing protein 1-like [Phragmites australis]|uniref:BTB/POZ and MATH domain-containing protein 1-like n=1 Tax=Phragmites australis TaxID=29695 RepID=UPI002D782B38|nr:BTB/POZ and MATH domain-containing protein 1-like [Phragmites australis]